MQATGGLTLFREPTLGWVCLCVRVGARAPEGPVVIRPSVSRTVTNMLCVTDGRRRHSHAVGMCRPGRSVLKIYFSKSTIKNGTRHQLYKTGNTTVKVVHMLTERTVEQRQETNSVAQDGVSSSVGRVGAFLGNSCTILSSNGSVTKTEVACSVIFRFSIKQPLRR